jgi:hypothetical protein
MRRGAFIVALVLFSVSSHAQIQTSTITAEQVEQAKLPKLTEIENLQFDNKIQRIQILQMQTEKAILDFQQYVKSLEKPGYTFNVDLRAYVPIPKEAGK